MRHSNFPFDTISYFFNQRCWLSAPLSFRKPLEAHFWGVLTVHDTVCTYMSIHVLYDHVWLDLRVRLYSADSLVFAIELFIRAAKTLSSLSAPFLLLSVSPALSVWLNTTLFHVHSSLLPISSARSAPSSLPLLHIFFFILLLSILTSSIWPFQFFFTSFSAPLLAIPLVFFSLFNLDFHRTLFCLCGSNSLSFYFFWWQSLIFTSPLSLSHPVSVSVSLHCHGLSLFPLTCSLMLLLY